MIYTTLLDGFVLIGVLFRRGLFVVATLGLHTHCRAVGCLTGTSLEQQVQHIFEVLGSYAAARFGDNLERMHGCGQLRHHFEPSLAAFLNSMLPHHARRGMHAPRFVPTLVGG